MKRLLFIIGMMFMLIPIQAQSVKELSLKIDSLQFKYDKLQHDYDCLYCEYHLNKLRTELEIFIHESQGSLNDIRLELYNVKKLDAHLTANYEVRLKMCEAYKKNYNATIFLITSKIENSNLNEYEIKNLQNIAESIEKCLGVISGILESYKEILDSYI